ncbi:MAG: hypothetical protein CL916_05470 [Deltaproteobacteria bacterium]|nr:hypothetical protein [Deltaproteobacteria bacterium]
MSNFFRSLFESSTRHPFSGRPELKYFANRITIYRSSGDIVAQPELIWKSGSKNGLIHSILAFSGRELPASEVIIFLNEQDYSRISRAWYAQCLDIISPLYFSLIRDRNIAQRFDTNVRFGFSPDGHNGLQLELQENEFAIGLFDNRHKETEESLPLVDIKAHIAAQSDTFQDLGVLYNDQIAWTLGAHPLDTKRMEKLQIPCALQISQNEHGELSFRTNPAYEYLGLRPVPNFLNRRQLVYRDRILMTFLFETYELNRRTLDKSMMLNVATETLQLSLSNIQLQKSGFLFQKNRFSQWMEGYNLYLHRGYEVNTNKEKALAVFRVQGASIYFKSLRPPCFVDDMILAANKEIELKNGMQINSSGLLFSFHAHPFATQKNWPYLGEVRLEPTSIKLSYGASYKIGRDQKCEIPLPNGNDNSNIVWRPEFVQQERLPFRDSSVSKSSISTYSIMVGPEHALLDLKGDPSLCILQKKYPAFIRRGEQVLSLSTPNRKKSILSGDEILVGNQVFGVYFHKTPIWKQAESILLETPLYRALIS